MIHETQQAADTSRTHETTLQKFSLMCFYRYADYCAFLRPPPKTLGKNIPLKRPIHKRNTSESITYTSNSTRGLSNLIFGIRKFDSSNSRLHSQSHKSGLQTTLIIYFDFLASLIRILIKSHTKFVIYFSNVALAFSNNAKSMIIIGYEHFFVLIEFTNNCVLSNNSSYGDCRYLYLSN